MNLDDYVRDREARDPEFKAAGEALRPQYQFQHALIAARVGAGLTQQQLAERVGKPQSTIARWESGRHQPRLDIIEAVARALGCQFAITPDDGLIYVAAPRSSVRTPRTPSRRAG
jgi:transcriptional regulator with XRE-family HTH domain